MAEHIMPVTKIVSGGQTGADRGGLEAALYCALPYGGWIPKGRKAEVGTVPAKYQGMVETASADYKARTEANVVDSDATVVFTHGTPSGGSLLTVELCLKHRRPWHNIDLALESWEGATSQIVRWLRGEIAYDYLKYQAKPPEQCVLNVAGSRESKAPGIQQQVMAILIDVISAANGTLFYPIRTDRPPMILREQEKDK